MISEIGIFYLVVVDEVYSIREIESIILAIEREHIIIAHIAIDRNIDIRPCPISPECMRAKKYTPLYPRMRSENRDDLLDDVVSTSSHE
jgi:hypothetical protein